MTIEIRRRVYRVAYPRNGNVGMTQTNRYVWDVWVDGKHIQVGVPTLREAKLIASRRGEFKVVR